jgi:hypothetical protein
LFWAVKVAACIGNPHVSPGTLMKDVTRMSTNAALGVWWAVVGKEEGKGGKTQRGRERERERERER